MKAPFAIRLVCAALIVAAAFSASRAASLTLEFKTEEGKPAEYEEVNVFLVDATKRSLEEAVKYSTQEKAFRTTFEELEPGTYILLVFTGNWDQVNDASRPGAFRAQEVVTLTADSDETVVVQYEHLDPQEFTGTEKASGRMADGSGKPLANVELKLAVNVDTAGLLPVENTRTGEDGAFEFSRLAPGHDYLLVDSQGEVLARIKPGDELTVRSAPRKGDPAPNISFVHLDSGEKKELADFKGKVVVVDFWASWCGPCQEPMARMQTYREKNPGWGEKVELIALSIDNTKEAAVNHLKKNGWNKTYNAWAGEGGFQAEGPATYSVRGIPAVYIIDQEGRIAANGHPMTLDIPKIINDLLEKSTLSQATQP